jgi:type IV pilus assembly protein PilC
MPVYLWEGKTRAGDLKKGEMNAPDDATVMMQLRKQQIFPTKVKVKAAAKSGVTIGGKVKEKDIVIFTRQFATMIDAGLPLVQCLEILSGQQESPVFKKILIQIKEDVESGSTFADALKKHPKVFNNLFVNLIAAGEVGGILDTILNRLSAYIEKSMKLKKQIKGAMVYPIVVMAIALIVVTIILIFVIPVFQQMFDDFGGTLPAPTRFVVALSAFVQKYILLIIVGIVIFIYICKLIYNTEKGREIIDDLALKSPVIGSLVRKTAVAKFTRTLSTMLTSGVPILDALDIVAKTAGNMTVEKAIMKTKVSISEGKTIAEPLAETKVFPSMVVQMIAVGEATGAMDTMLSKIADFYEEEVDVAVAALTSMLEPLLMVFLGGAIGGLVIAMYLPIFKIASAIG